MAEHPSIFGLFGPQWFEALVEALRVVEAQPTGLHYLLVDVCQTLLGWTQLFPKSGELLPLEVEEPAAWLMRHLVSIHVAL